MFNRRTSQKPSDDLYKKFRASFPALHGPVAPSDSTTTTTTAPDGSTIESTTAHSTRLSDALDIALHRSLNQDHDIKDGDRTPRASHDPWNFTSSGLTPSMMDPTSQSFSMFANQLPGYYTPPGGSNMFYHSQAAGDLHTPGFGLGLNTPLSMPTSESALHAGAPQQTNSFDDFHPHLAQHHGPPQQFSNVDPMQMHQHSQSGFPPHHFSHQPAFDPLEGAVDDSPIDDMTLDVGIPPMHPSAQMLFHSQALQEALRPPIDPSGEIFRYHTTLNAPTAMVKQTNEIPVTYLNKGQTYTLNVVDTQHQPTAMPVRYRTFVRVSFESEEQRYKPAACWQLWKEGRGTNEAHQRGGRLQAVEYVDTGLLGNGDDPSKPKLQLESASFDGFCVTWSPTPGTAECPISVRFNFLSTDFSHSKGVKGIPVRLCAKTQLLGDPSSSAVEVCYCQVKLFRDHGAERKLSNDIAHVKKGIDKVQAQIAQLESGQTSGKRKRAGSLVKGAGVEGRPAKVPKHRRTWSLSSVTSGSGRGTVEDDLHLKLRGLQDMFTSTRPASVLNLRGAEADDPDLHPVKLSGQPSLPVRTESDETTQESIQTAHSSSPTSPSASPAAKTGRQSTSTSAAQQQQQQQQQHQPPTPIPAISRSESSDWRTSTQPTTTDITPVSNTQALASPPSSTTIKPQPFSPTTTALDIDPSYTAPLPQPTKSLASFYIRPLITGKPSPDPYYRAIYLSARTLPAFVRAAAAKAGVPATSVLRCLRVTRAGLHVVFDDEAVRNLPEGQDIVAEFCEFQPEMPSSSVPVGAGGKRKRGGKVGESEEEEEKEGGEEEGKATGFELRLQY